MTNIPNTGELFATDQVSPDTERCYKHQLHNFPQWMQDSQGKGVVMNILDVYGKQLAVDCLCPISTRYT